MAGEAGRLIRLTPVLVLPLLLAGAAAIAPDPVRTLAGRVSRQFPDGLIDGTRYTGEDIAELVPVATNAAYVRVHLDYANGHQCDIAGVARAEGGRLVYHDPSPPIAGTTPCTLSIARVGRSLAIDDAGGSCSSYCGARGTLSAVAIPWASHRPITYLTRLRASSRYRDALTEWRTGKPVR